MKKKKYNLFKFLFSVVFLIYLVLFISTSTGYYEYNNHKKTVLTEEQIRKFENDIKEGKNIDIDEYLIKEDHKYSNKLSVITINISDKISKLVTNGVKGTFKYISKFIDN